MSKVTVKSQRYTNILMGTVQFAIANGVLDAVREGYLPKDQVNDLGIICSVWLALSIINDDNPDHKRCCSKSSARVSRKPSARPCRTHPQSMTRAFVEWLTAVIPPRIKRRAQPPIFMKG
ncbi:formaldehyde-activating enzyme [Granulibacter bethesdensis]|uniref:formaldehyde-activating enzyme n=1 Tax=Granulibacter bethesdensis TaxID=364410 RepID=UPI001C12C4A4|nr:formaldehyde-activating enzyme [Granulibacter bethesdensis]